MSISKVKYRDGSIHYSVRHFVDGKRATFGTYATLEEAERIERRIKAQVNATRSEGVTLAAFSVGWLDWRETVKMVRTSRHERSKWKTWVMSSWISEMPIRRIKTQHVLRWLTELQESTAWQTGTGIKRKTERKLAVQTIRGIVKTLDLCFRYAVATGRADSNPVPDAYPFIKAETRVTEAWTYLEPDEIARVLDAVAPGKNYHLTHEEQVQRWAAYHIAIFCGLRAGEIWGLRWTDVRGLDSDRPELFVGRSFDKPTKSGKTRRVPLWGKALAAMQTLQREAPGIGNALLFPSKAHTMHVNGYDAQWATVKRWAGIDRKVRFHDLRHTCASHLVKGTWGRHWRLEEVRDYLGHGSISVTQRYAHLGPEGLHDAASKTGNQVAIAQVFSGSSDKNKRQQK